MRLHVHFSFVLFLSFHIFFVPLHRRPFALLYFIIWCHLSHPNLILLKISHLRSSFAPTQLPPSSHPMTLVAPYSPVNCRLLVDTYWKAAQFSREFRSEKPPRCHLEPPNPSILSRIQQPEASCSPAGAFLHRTKPLPNPVGGSWMGAGWEHDNPITI